MKYLAVLIVFFSTNLLQAQSRIKFVQKNETIQFKVSDDEVYVEYLPNHRGVSQRNSTNILVEDFAILKKSDVVNNRTSSHMNVISDSFARTEPVLIYKDGTKQVARGEINLKLKPEGNISEVLKTIKYTYELNPFKDGLYLVKTELNTAQLFQLVTRLQKHRMVEYADPNFLRMIKPYNDTHLARQWAVENTGSSRGTVDADMDVREAWRYTRGSGIVVAVIDEGVELSHPDLIANLLPGYDATGNGSRGGANRSNNDSHGTACAGIIAAEANNRIGIRGIANEASILPVRIAYSKFDANANRRKWEVNDNWIANGIRWAAQNGANVLSNSWGGGSPSSTKTDAINDAVNQGIIVLFSSGNENKEVSYPANLDNVIAVGASTMCDERKRSSSNSNLVGGDVNPDPMGVSCDRENRWGSNYGDALDIVAPGVEIYTTDLTGAAGSSFGDYNPWFNGTSSACPNAAGVVALILSANPSLSSNEVREILESTTDKISGYSYSTSPAHPNGSWDNEVGYGRVNALRAVESALAKKVSISNINNLCTNGTKTIYLYGNDSNLPVSWSSSYNVDIVSSGNSYVTVRGSSSHTTSGQGWVRAALGSSNASTKNDSFWVGKPNFKLEYSPMGINYVEVTMVSANGTDIHSQGITSTSWQKVSSNGGCYASFGGNGFTGLGHGSCNNWNMTIGVSATNACGTTTIYQDLTPPAPAPCEYSYRIASTASYAYRIIIDPCENLRFSNRSVDGYSSYKTEEAKVRVYDYYGHLVFQIDKLEFDLSSLKRGFYIIKVLIDDQIVTKNIMR